MAADDNSSRAVSQGAARCVSPIPPERRRRRKALSCYDCKRRKLRCDREQPACSRCINGGIASTCTYDFQSFDNDDDASGEPTRSPRDYFASSKQRKTTELADHVKQLEDRLAFFETRARQPSTTASNHATPREALGPYESEPAIVTMSGSMFVRAHGFKSQFYGPTKAAGLIAHMPELSRLMQKAFHQNERGARLLTEVKASKKRENELRRQTLDTSRPVYYFLPSKEALDDFVRIYFATIETVYRVLHYHQFMKEYDHLWKDPSKAREGFVVLLLLIAACVRCESERVSTGRNASTGRVNSVTGIEISEQWLERQSQKHVTLTYFQAKILLVIAKQVNHVKQKREWTSVCSLFQLFLSAGLHRDPRRIIAKQPTITGSLNREGLKPAVRISPFEQDMRRRLWATVVELELQASLQQGMTSMGHAYPYDTEAPSNVEDDELWESSHEVPTPRSPDQFTATSYLSISHTSLRFRSSLNALLNHPDTELSYEEVMKYEATINRYVQAIPTFMSPARPRSHAQTSSSYQPRHNLARSMLELQLLQFLLMLHSPFICSSIISQSRYSSMVCIQTATRIISIYQTLNDTGMHSFALMRHDVFRAPMALAHSTLASVVPLHDFIMGSLLEPVSKAMQTALDLLTDCSLRLGIGSRELWVIAAATTLVKSKVKAAGQNDAMEEVVDEVIRVLGRIAGIPDMMQLPTPAPSLNTIVAPNQAEYGAQQSNLPYHANGVLPSNMDPIAARFDNFNPDFSIPIGELNDPFDFNQMTDWTFEQF